MTEAKWLPIESAPKDGTQVDLWIVKRHARTFTESDGNRVTDAMWAGVKRDDDAGWRARDGGFRWELVEQEYEGTAIVATHWMPLPLAPDSSPTFSNEAVSDQVSLNQTSLLSSSDTEVE